MSYYIDDSVIEEIKDKVEIVDLINQYLPLKKSGANYVGLCPFHTEKTPSFSVSEPNQFFHCFGCGSGGDIFEFIMKKENLSFVDSVKFLGDKYGIELRESTEAEKRLKDEKEKYYQINRLVAQYYLDNLARNKQALDYLATRGISYKLSRQFGLGYAKDSWDDLYLMLKNQGHPDEILEELGLVAKRKNSPGYYDKFRNRLIFPIIDTKSRVIGFGARVMDQSLPKYLNSQETPVFHKGTSLYGLNMLDRHSRKDNVILVEGYMDVIALFRNGIYSSLASLGTAFTPRQAQIIKRYGRQVYICYDGDPAGIKATNKAIEILLEEGIRPKVISLGESKDPDDYFKVHGKDDFLKLMDKAMDFMDFKIAVAKDNYDLEQIDGKVRFTNEVAGELRLLTNSIEQDLYINKLAQDLNIDKEAIKKEVNKNRPRPSYTKPNQPNIRPEQALVQKTSNRAEIEILKILLLDREYFEIIRENTTFDYFEDPSCLYILEEIIQAYGQKEDLDKLELYGIIKSKDHLDTSIVESVFNKPANYTASNINQAIGDLLISLQVSALDRRRKNVRDKIENLDKNRLDIEESNKLLEELLRLNSELDKIRYKDRG